jgi:protein-S-isoprenylcysteine O-methyltransferase Ste14
MLAAAGLQRALARSAPMTTTSRLASAVIAAGAGTALLAPVIDFRRHRTTVDPRADAEPSALVTGGLNAFSRNPMYLGMAGLLVANATRRPAPSAVLPLVCFVAWMDRRQIPMEEEALRTQFGRDYDRYRALVPRWIGPPRSTASVGRPRSGEGRPR